MTRQSKNFFSNSIQANIAKRCFYRIIEEGKTYPAPPPDNVWPILCNVSWAIISDRIRERIILLLFPNGE